MNSPSEWSERDTRTTRSNFIHATIAGCTWHGGSEWKTGVTDERRTFWRRSLLMGHNMYIPSSHTRHGAINASMPSTQQKIQWAGPKSRVPYWLNSSSGLDSLSALAGTHGKRHDGRLDCRRLQQNGTRAREMERLTYNISLTRHSNG